MHKGLVTAASALLLLAATGCGQLGGRCEDCAPAEGTGGTGSATLDAKPIPQGELVVGYLPTWGAKLSNYASPAILSRLTHVAIAFVTVDATGVYFKDPNDVRAFINVAHQHDVKVLMSIGGAAESDLVAEAAATDLPGLVAKMMKVVDDLDFDGIDVDIEGGAVDHTYAPLVAALNTEIRARGMVLSSGVGNWFEQRIEQSALNLFDFVSVMALSLIHI